MRILRFIFTPIGFLLKKTYRYSDNYDPHWKYVYYFFYQRILMFNIHVPWPVHYTSSVVNVKNISLGIECLPGAGPNQYIQGANGIIFGNNIQIGPGVKIISANHAPNDYKKHLPSNPIIIGANVWIGANAVVLPGVEIGNNVIIGAGSIVTKNIPANTVAVGNPCVVIKVKTPYNFE